MHVWAICSDAELSKFIFAVEANGPLSVSTDVDRGGSFENLRIKLEIKKNKNKLLLLPVSAVLAETVFLNI